MQIEKEEDRKQYELLTSRLPFTERRENGMTWFPIAIRDTEIGRGDFLTVEVERTTHQDLLHHLRFGMTVALFFNHDPKKDRAEGNTQKSKKADWTFLNNSKVGGFPILRACADKL